MRYNGLRYLKRNELPKDEERAKRIMVSVSFYDTEEVCFIIYGLQILKESVRKLEGDKLFQEH